MSSHLSLSPAENLYSSMTMSSVEAKSLLLAEEAAVDSLKTVSLIY
jgi:hypothetical protein